MPDPATSPVGGQRYSGLMQPVAYYVDFSFSQPPPLAVKAAGYQGVCVYLGAAMPDGAYFQACRDAGLAILPIQEWGTTSAYGGYQVGFNMAVQANDRLDSIGAPQDITVVYVAADAPLTPEEEQGPLHEWAAGIAAAGRRGFKMAYGNERALQFAGAPFWWGVETWSNTRNGLAGWEGKTPPVAMIQMANTRTHFIPGYDTDENIVLIASFGQWGANPAADPAPVTDYSEGTNMLKFTDSQGTACQFFTAGSNLYVRYWKGGRPDVPVLLSNDVEPDASLLPISAFGITVVQAACHSRPGMLVEAYPSVFGYVARVI